MKISRQELALIGITLIWGTSFLIIHLAMQYSGPLFFVGLRFLVAGLIGLLVFRRFLPGLTRQEVYAGMAIGISILAGYGLQTYGLQTITSSQSAFITAMYVPLVPLLQWLVMRRPPSHLSLVGVACAFVGLLLLAGPETGSLSLSRGEGATLISALAIAAEILLIGHFAGKVHAGRVTLVQLLTAGLLAFLLMPVAGEPLPAFSWIWLVAGVSLGAASILIQFTMNWAQQSVSPTRATVIYASEPVWGGVVGRLAGDRLPALALLGGLLIVIGVLITKLKPSFWKGPRTPKPAEIPSPENKKPA